MPKLLPLLFLLIGFGLLAGGTYTLTDTLDLREVADRVPATIVDVDTSSDSDGTTYSPIYEYAYQGETRRHAPSTSTSSRPTIGATEILLIDPSDPGKVKAETFMGQWFLPTLLLGMGVVFALVGVGTLWATRSRRSNPQDYSTPTSTNTASVHTDDHADHDPFMNETDQPTSSKGPFL